MQIPPLAQGPLVQAFPCSHLDPLKPTLHLHANAFTPDVHVPPFRQGFGAQELDPEHLGPVKPAPQTHANEDDPMELHIPPLKQGLELHGLVSSQRLPRKLAVHIHR